MAYRLAGLILGLGTTMTPAIPTAPAADHAVRIDHHSGPVDARYRGTVAIRHRQVGAVAPAGRPQTLRCRWSADLIVDRHATSAAGATMSRRLSRDDVATGQRPGWCGTQRAAIAQEVAARVEAMDRHLVAVAREDHDTLRAELDRLHGATRGG